MSWNVVAHQLGAGPVQEADAKLMAGLVSGAHAIVVFKGLFPEPVFSRNRDRIFTLFDQAITTTYSNGRLTTVGPYLAKFASDPPSYFAAAAAAAATSSDAGIDLARHTRERLAVVLGLAAFEPAVEPDGTGYADHNIRIYQEGVATPLHNDNIMRDMAAGNLVLKSLASHYSCVICVQECDAGGSLELYRRGWTPDDERYKIPGGFGYDTAVVKGSEKVRFKPETGDVYLFDPTQYHAIEPSVGRERVTMGFFFGFRDAAPGEAIAWV